MISTRVPTRLAFGPSFMAANMLKKQTLNATSLAFKYIFCCIYNIFFYGMSIAAFVPLIFASTPNHMAQSDRYGYLLGMDASALQDLYELFQANPEQVAPDWRLFFEGFDLGVHHDSGRPEQSGTSPATEQSATQDSGGAAGGRSGLTTTPSSGGALGRDEFAVAALIQAYRSRGHLISKTNPIR